MHAPHTEGRWDSRSLCKPCLGRIKQSFTLLCLKNEPRLIAFPGLPWTQSALSCHEGQQWNGCAQAFLSESETWVQQLELLLRKCLTSKGMVFLSKVTFQCNWNYRSNLMASLSFSLIISWFVILCVFNYLPDLRLMALVVKCIRFIRHQVRDLRLMALVVKCKRFIRHQVRDLRLMALVVKCKRFIRHQVRDLRLMALVVKCKRFIRHQVFLSWDRILLIAGAAWGVFWESYALFLVQKLKGCILESYVLFLVSEVKGDISMSGS